MDVPEVGRRTSTADAVVIGAGPAGLTASYLLTKQGRRVAVLEADPTYVGGISKTASYHGYRFDIGGHRFFSKSDEVEALWTELLGPDLLERPRSSRIFYNGQFYSYPLKAFEALFQMGLLRSVQCVASYGRAKLFPVKDPKTFEEWVVNQFGRRLFEMFFKTYTEKVWGMACNEISADWAAQRIKGLSLGTAIFNALRLKPRGGAKTRADRGSQIKTLIDSFRYPRHGPGMMWEAAARKTTEQGGEIHMGSPVSRLTLADDGTWVVEGPGFEVRAADVISSMPLRELFSSLSPPPSPAAQAAAKALRYRDFLIVALVLPEKNLFSDNWIYIHDASVRVGRIQNFKSWSPEMVPDSSMCCYGLEYFCFENDSLWAMPDDALVALASRELEALGLGKASQVSDGCVVRQKKAYPVYDAGYQEAVTTLRAEIAQKYPRLHLVGRNGMHKYNNQDHAMMTAMLTAKNILAGKTAFDVWAVNQDAEYHEEASSGAVGAVAERLVPTRTAP